MSRTLRFAVLLRDGARCLYCGVDLRPSLLAWLKRRTGRRLTACTVDHLIPQVLGGGHTAANLVAACRRCNCQRHTQRWETYASVAARRRIRAAVRRPVEVERARQILAQLRQPPLVERQHRRVRGWWRRA